MVRAATTTLEFTPTKSGSFGLACGMNMLHGTLIVEQDGVDSEGTDEPYEGHEAHVTFAEAVGVGPMLEVGVRATSHLNPHATPSIGIAVSAASDGRYSTYFQ